MTTPALLTLAEGSSPATPGAGYASLYPDASGLLHIVDNVSDKPVGMYQIATVTNVGTATISFTNIPATYKHLRVMGLVRSGRAALSDSLSVRFGTGGGAVDAGANYTYSAITNTNTTLAGASLINATQCSGPIIDGANSAANSYNAIECFIPNYQSAYFKPVTWNATVILADGTLALTTFNIAASAWRNTGAITSMTFLGGNAASGMVVGSSLTLYGVY